MSQERTGRLVVSPTVLDRCAGVLVGLAAGDALGAGYEFGPPLRGDPQMIGGGLGPWEPGEWTDDTQMSLCVAEVAATGVLDVEAVGERFLSWYRSGPKDVGNQTRAVLGRASSGRNLPRVAADYSRAHPHNSAGNGSLMRTAPVALAHLGDDEAIAESARAVSSLTHADPLATEACVLWCIAMDRAIREARLDGAYEGLRLLRADQRDGWAVRLREAEDRPPSAFNPNGFVVAAFQAAHAAITQTEIPEDQPGLHLRAALRVAVRVGDDTDTVAAIAGALLGARWGVSAVPADWRSLIHGWPGYRCDDLVRLAACSAQGGTDVDSARPS